MVPWPFDLMRGSDFIRKASGPFVGIGLQAAGLGLGLLVNFLLARALKPEGYGVYGFAYSLVALLCIPLQSGLATLLIKDVTRYRVEGDAARLHGLLRASLGIAVFISSIAGLALFGFSWVQQAGKFGAYATVLPMAVLLIPLMSLAAILGGTLRGLDQPLIGMLPDAIVRPALFALLLVVALLFPWIKPSSALAMGLHACAAGAGTLFGAWMVMRFLPAELTRSVPVWEWRQWLSALLPLSMLAGLQAVSSVVATLSLGLYHSPQDVGYYRAAELGSSLVSMPLGAVAAYAAGGVATYFAAADRQALQHELTSMGRIVLLAALPTALILILAGKPLLRLAFGDEYAPAAMPLAILCAGQLMNALAGLSGVLATMSGHYREATRALAAALAVQALVAVLLVPEHGAAGAAVAAALGTSTWSHVLRLRMKRLLGVDTSSARRFAE